MTTEDPRERVRLEELLAGYLTKVPPRVAQGNWNTSVDFKAAVNAAKKVRDKRGVRLGELQSAINTLHRFWT